MRQIPVSFYVISKQEGMVAAICPRTQQGLHDQRARALRDSYQRGEHEGATESAPRKAASAAASPHHDASGSRGGEAGSSGVCGAWIWPRTLELNDYRSGNWFPPTCSSPPSDVRISAAPCHALMSLESSAKRRTRSRKYYPVTPK